MTPSKTDDWEPVITLVQCPWCKDNWIDENHEYVCNTCSPKVTVLQTVLAVHASIREVDRNLTFEQIKEHLPLLRRAKDHLDAIVETASK